MESDPAAFLLLGHVMHQRLRPAKNHFVYPVFYLRLNLSRLNELNSFWFGVNSWRPVSIQVSDYGPRDGSSLILWMRDVLNKSGILVDGDIWLQTFPRIFGFAFNPVSFWLCHDKKKNLVAVLAEVNNTFGETHRYLLVPQEGGAINADSLLDCKKQLHVSPFCEVRGHYRFCFRDTENSAFVGIDYHDDDGLLIKTSIVGKSQAMRSSLLISTLLKQPFLTVGIVARICWQALKLWLKHVPFFHKPEPPINGMSVNKETIR